MKKLESLLGSAISPDERIYYDRWGGEMSLSDMVLNERFEAKKHIMALEKTLAELHDVSMDIEGNDFNRFVQDKVRHVFGIIK